MVERTFKAFEAFLLFAGKGFVDKGVELLLLPPMAEVTCLQPFATFLVARDEGSALPIFAQFGHILE